MAPLGYAVKELASGDLGAHLRLGTPHQQAVHLVGTRALSRAACALVSQLCPYAPTATTRPVSTAIRDASSVDQPMRELRLAR